MHTLYFKKNKGFTLIEIMVSLGIFSIVMVVALGAFLKISDVNKRAQSIKTAVNNVNFTLEAMSRELRTGSNYHCASNLGTGEAQDCVNPNGEAQIYFNSGKIVAGEQIYISYKFTGNKIQKAVGTASSIDAQFADVTSAGVVVTGVFMVHNSTVTDGMPYVQIRMSGEVGSVAKAKSNFDIQTTISQRLSN